MPVGIIKVEGTSKTTLGNFLNSAPLFRLDKLSEANPLQVVSTKAHWDRAAYFGGLVLPGVSMELVDAKGEADAYRSIQERVMERAWRVALWHAPAGNHNALRRRSQIIEVPALMARPLLRTLIK